MHAESSIQNSIQTQSMQTDLSMTPKAQSSPSKNSSIDLECKEDMPTLSPCQNLKRRRVLPPFFSIPSFLQDSEDDPVLSHREALRRMRVAAQIALQDIEDRTAERRRELADYYEGDTPRTSQESGLSDYDWSAREGGDTVPLDEILSFVFQYLTRPRIFDRVAEFTRLTEEMFEEDPELVHKAVATVLNCEPIVLYNILEDAICVAEGIYQDGEDYESD